MAKTWQLQEAKNKLSEVVRRATTEGPQVISVHGKEAAVVVSIPEYRRRRNSSGPARSLVETIFDPAVRGIELDIEPVSVPPPPDLAGQ